jgi:hypothetical protein
VPPPITLRRVVITVEVLAILPSLGVAVMSGLLFDAPGSENNPFNWMILYGAAAYSVVTIASLVASRLLRGHPAWSRACLVLPVLPVLVSVAGFVLDMTVCGGNLVCNPGPP